MMTQETSTQQISPTEPMSEKPSRLARLHRAVKNWLSDTDNRSVLVPYCIFAFFAVLCYLLFCYHDILVTANHSTAYLDGRIFDYYTASYEMDGTYGSNYLPPVFLLFAVWNLPLKLFGALPEFFGDWGIGFVLWNKLLPTLAYFAAACVLFRLALYKLGFGRGKAMIAALMLLSSPIAFFSQFIFCQYDSFVILFMLLGMYFFFGENPSRRDMILFGLFFGLATTIKYFAAVVFAVLLVLREKKVQKIVLHLIPFAAPFCCFAGFYLIFDRHAFIQSVFKFAALGYAGDNGFQIGGYSVNLIYLALILICAFAYFTKPTDHYNLLGWVCFYSCGISFVLFGMMSWHPQWLLFAVPFWTLSTMINKHWDVHMLFDTAMGVIFPVYIAHAFYHQTDETLFRYGLLSGELQFSEFSRFSVRDLIPIDASLLLTILVALFAIAFIFKHPRFNMENPDGEMPYVTRYISVRFLCGMMAFLVPAFACLPSFLSRPQLLYATFSDVETQKSLELTASPADTVQNFSIVGSSIDFLQLYTLPAEVPEEDESSAETATTEPEEGETEETEEVPIITVEIFDPATVTVLASVSVPLTDVTWHGYTYFEIEGEVVLTPNAVYQLRIYTSEEHLVQIGYGTQSRPTYKYYNVLMQEYSNSVLVYQGEAFADGENALIQIYGKQ